VSDVYTSEEDEEEFAGKQVSSASYFFYFMLWCNSNLIEHSCIQKHNIEESCGKPAPNGLGMVYMEELKIFENSKTCFSYYSLTILWVPVFQIFLKILNNCKCHLLIYH
jgi:hypothetical protein